ncbi:MAG: acetyl/propionyl/methylcrotonyl-CoA carboxylase subunit alpha [Parvularculales bacterium]
MFEKILIANRGEIACRVIKTARRMGIKTVAVYSEADSRALHVEMADEAVAIGPPPASESYLVMERIIEAARQTGAGAIHPGYGFLSENAAFVEALSTENITFIGPNADAVRLMGDKISARDFAMEAGVNTVPGCSDVITGAKQAIGIAEDIGYPVMIKAAAGGGGKGMRIAHTAREVEEGFTSSMNEARASFGDDRVYIEKFVTSPRHIEIQVLADGHGNAIYLGERECSIQRRNQKVIEEAPSPFLDDKTREAMGAQAVALAKAASYQSAGTVEFIVDESRNFYFLEMNTRLQVEHPITELITGIDLVEQMIRIAAGEKLSLTQKDVSLKGWAMEGRIYAEDPYRSFLPSVGRLVRYHPPEERAGESLVVRNDTGVYEGGEISIYYDPMIAKLCTWSPDRMQAIDAMSDALDGFRIEGIRHNIPFLSAVMEHERFRAGTLTTNFIAEEYPSGFQGVALDSTRSKALAAVALFVTHIEMLRAQGIAVATGREEHVLTVRMDDEFHHGRIKPGSDGLHIFWREGDVGEQKNGVLVSSDWKPGMTIFEGKVGSDYLVVQMTRDITGSMTLTYRGTMIKAVVMTPGACELVDFVPREDSSGGGGFLLCPMPGLVVSIGVVEGQEVKAGEPLAVVEAMKMENILRAERDCTVSKIKCAPGDNLSVDDVMMELE